MSPGCRRDDLTEQVRRPNDGLRIQRRWLDSLIVRGITTLGMMTLMIMSEASMETARTHGGRVSVVL